MAAPQAWSGWVVVAVPPHWTSQVSSIPGEDGNCDAARVLFIYLPVVWNADIELYLEQRQIVPPAKKAWVYPPTIPKHALWHSWITMAMIDIIVLYTYCLPRDSLHPYWRPPPQSHCLPRSQTCTCTPEWADPWPGGGSTGAGAGGWPPRPCQVASSLRSPGPGQARADCYVTPHYDHIMASGLQVVTFLFAGIIGNPGPVGNQCITPATGQPRLHIDTWTRLQSS